MKVAIIKYNAGNIFSVDYALKRIGITPIITADKETIMKADKVIFPGQGEAETTMKYLKEHNLDKLMKDLARTVTRRKKPEYFQEKTSVDNKVKVNKNA